MASDDGPGFSRYISVVSNNIGLDTKVLFIFDVLATTGGAAYQSYFPAVWRILDFPAQGNASQLLSYKNESAWIQATVENNIVTDTSKYVVASIGQQTDIIGIGGDLTAFTPPFPSSDSTITQVNNLTLTNQDVALGFVPPQGGNPVLVVQFVNVAPGSNAKAGIGHNCRAYIVNGHDFQEGQIMNSPISSYITPLWQQGLATFDEDTTLFLTYDSNTTQYTLSNTPSFQRVKEIGLSGKELKQRAKQEEANKRSY